TLLAIMLFVGKWAKLIPMASLAGILVVVAYNMSEWKSFRSILKGPRSDMAVMLATFLLTVLVDLTVAIEIGIVLASFLFIFRISKISNVTPLHSQMKENGEHGDPELNDGLKLPDDVEVYEINGPLFFGAAQNFKETLRMMHRSPRMMVIRMRYVSIIDATGLHHLKSTLKDFAQQGVQVVLSGVNESVYTELKKAGIVDQLGEEHVFSNIDDARIWVQEHIK
ncbi:MAG: SulP family inorganic anion transporter, partial [Bacteroidales bacterium]|nr:SulP family inorganic anion transporter [Bacteroidales bacterium]